MYHRALLWFGLLVATTNAFLGLKKPAGIASSILRSSRRNIDKQIEISFEGKAAPSIDTGLSALILKQLNGQEALNRVLYTIQTYTAESTCNKAAYASLTHSCNPIEGGANENTINTLDLAKTTFAARLAVCELAEAGQGAVPPACAFILEDLNAASTRDHYDGAQIKACTSGMHGDGRAWNSFSNAKQNAIRICHATRSHVEREATLRQVQHILAQHHRDSDSSIDFAVAVEKIRSNILAAVDRLTEGTELAGRLNAAYIVEYESYLKEHREHDLAMSKTMQDAIKAAFQLITTDSEAAHLKMLDLVNGKTDLAVGRISGLADGLQAVQQGFDIMDSSLAVLGNKIVAMEDRMEPLSKSMVKLTLAVEDLHNVTQANTIAQEEAGVRVSKMLLQIEGSVESILSYSTTATQCFQWLTSGTQWLKLLGLFLLVLCAPILLTVLALLLSWRLRWLQRFIIHPVRDVWQGLCDG